MAPRLPRWWRLFAPHSLPTRFHFTPPTTQRSSASSFTDEGMEARGHQGIHLRAMRLEFQDDETPAALCTVVSLWLILCERTHTLNHWDSDGGREPGSQCASWGAKKLSGLLQTSTETVTGWGERLTIFVISRVTKGWEPGPKGRDMLMASRDRAGTRLEGGTGTRLQQVSLLIYDNTNIYWIFHYGSEIVLSL